MSKPKYQKGDLILSFEGWYYIYGMNQMPSIDYLRNDYYGEDFDFMNVVELWQKEHKIIGQGYYRKVPTINEDWDWQLVESKQGKGAMPLTIWES